MVTKSGQNSEKGRKVTTEEKEAGKTGELKRLPFDDLRAPFLCFVQFH